MRFERIPACLFAEFHKSFQGDTSDTFKVCLACGGACEFNKVGTLMPGEREYMAEAAGLSVDEFSARYLDFVRMENGRELDVLRLINGCPFLNRGSFKCDCREYKVVLCEIYPLAFYVRQGVVHFELDDWCPISDTSRFRQRFLEVGVPAIKKLAVPVEWYECVARYDDLYFDYLVLQAYRKDVNKPQTFTIEELLSFQRTGQENNPKERFHPYPAEVEPYAATPRLALPLLPVLQPTQDEEEKTRGELGSKPQ
jgi:Fe-S-cluster containining protein